MCCSSLLLAVVCTIAEGVHFIDSYLWLRKSTVLLLLGHKNQSIRIVKTSVILFIIDSSSLMQSCCRPESHVMSGYYM